MKKLVAVSAAVLLVGVSIGGCGVSTTSDASAGSSSSSSSQTDTWAAWAVANRSKVEDAGAALRKAENSTAPYELSSYANQAGVLLAGTTTSPDGGVVSGHLHSAGSYLITAAKDVDNGDYTLATSQIYKASGEVQKASDAVPSDATLPWSG